MDIHGVENHDLNYSLKNGISISPPNHNEGMCNEKTLLNGINKIKINNVPTLSSLTSTCDHNLSSSCDNSTSQPSDSQDSSTDGNRKQDETSEINSTEVSDTIVKNSSESLCENILTKDEHSADDLTLEIHYMQYESEKQMDDIMRLIQKDLSEPYSIYTYRYFIHNWPRLCFLVSIL